MDDRPITVERIRLADLPAYARSFTGPAAGGAPITCIRARSQSLNPYARPQDVALLAAICEGRVVGAHGVVPGLLARKGSLSRVHWSSAVYVEGAFRGRGVGRRLVEAFKSLAKDVAVPAGMTPGAEGLYRACGFQSTGRLNFFQLRVDRIERTPHWLRSPAPARFFYGQRTESLLGWLARQSWRMQKTLFYRRALARLSPIDATWSTVSRIRHFDRVPPYDRTVFFRGTKAVNWMLAHPWVYSMDTATIADLRDEVRHYYFTKTRPLFRYAAFELTGSRRDAERGFVVLSLSRSRKRSTVRILDHETRGSEAVRTAAGLALVAAGSILADRVEVPLELAVPFKNDPLLQPLIKGQSPCGLGAPASSHSPLARAMGRITLSLSDGDAGFT